MKLTILPTAAFLACAFACSAKSGDPGSDTGSGGSSSTGATSSVGMQPNLGTAGGPMLNPTAGTGGMDTGVGKECGVEMFKVASKPADVILVLDRSKSMIEHNVPPDGKTRWDAVVPSVTAVISATDSSISWGLKLFPEGEGEACSAPTVTDAIPAQIMAGNAATVNGIIMQTQALGNGTPTGDAIKKATAYLQSRGVPNQYILLATDGDPSCPDGDEVAEPYAIEAIAAAKTAGFPTYVIGVLDPMMDSGKFPTLNAMAEAGGTALSDNPVAPKFFQAYSQQELTTALMKVTGQVVSCEFPFSKRPPKTDNIAVHVNGVSITQDPSRQEGWEYTSDQFMGIQLYGSACQQVKDATENNVNIIFGCNEPVK